MSSKSKWCLAGTIISSILFLAFLGIGIFTSTSLHGILITQAANTSALSPKEYNLWGQVPGQYDINVTNGWVLFNFTNPFEVFYYNETPILVETRTYLYREYQNLSDTVYTANDDNNNPTVVNFNYQKYYLDLNTSPSDLLTTINLGAIGIWYMAHIMSDAQIATYGLAGLLEALAQVIPTTIQATEMSLQCVPTQEVTNRRILEKSGIIDPELQNFMWNDPLNGLSNEHTLSLWVHALAEGPHSGAAQILADYFYLTNNQAMSLFSPSGLLARCVNGLNSSIANTFNCSTTPCDPSYLVAIEWSSGAVTSKSSGGTSPDNCPTCFNDTNTGYIDISAYLNNYFIPTYKVDPVQYNISFPWELTYSLFNRTPSTGSKYDTNTDPNTLLNVGNLNFMFKVGRDFDAQKNITNLEPLSPIKNQFNLSSLEQAHVLWKYMDYLQGEFILRNGTKGQLALGQGIGNALYESFITAQNYLLPDLTARLIWNNLTNNSMKCNELLIASIGLTPDEAATICGADILKDWNLDTIKLLIAACNEQGGEAYMSLYETGLGSEVATFCGTFEENTFGNMLKFSEAYLKDFYNCAPSYSKALRCSNFEIAAKQWMDSSITSFVPQNLNLSVSDSLADWYPELFSKPFEYMAVLKKISKNFTFFNVTSLDYTTTIKLLNFDNLYNAVRVQDAFIFSQQELWSNFSESFYNIPPYELTSYLRYMMMEVALAGFYQTRSIGELLWGYNDSLLVSMKEANPLDSGDPSINPFINLAGQNSSYENGLNYAASMYTGLNDSTLTRQIITFYGKDYITYPYSYFNGSDVVSDYVSPWAEKILFNSTDGSVNHPGFNTSDSLPLYINDYNFQTELVWNNSTRDYNGIETYTYCFVSNAFSNKENNPDNAKYYADKWEGFLNVTTVQDAPIFISKPHFLDADTTLANAVEIYSDSSLSQKISSSQADNPYLDIEPYSGVPLGVKVGLQLNYEFKSDELFTYPNTAMIPIVTSYESLNFTDEQIDEAYGLLRTGLFLVNYGPLIGFLCAGFFLLLAVLCFIRRRKILKEISNAGAGEEVSAYRRMGSNETEPPLEIVGDDSLASEIPERETKLLKISQEIKQDKTV